MEGDVAEDGEGAAVVASTLRHRECVVLPVVIALFHKNIGDFFRIFSLLFEKIRDSLSINCLTCLTFGGRVILNLNG